MSGNKVFVKKVLGDGISYEGEMVNGLPEGKGIYHFKEGYFSGEFIGGKYNGHGKMHYYPVGDEKDDIFDNGDYVEGKLLEGNWKDNKMDGRFVVYQHGIPYDYEFSMGKEVDPKIYYDIPMPNDEVAPGTIRCLYGGQSCFLVETVNETFVFDWYRASMPSLRKDKPIYVFISHAHMDHFNRRIFNLVDDFDDVHFYMGMDIDNEEKEFFEKNFNRIFEKVDDNIEYFVGNEELDTDFGQVSTLKSTDLGVAFLVKTKDITLFHAGDLSLFSAVGSMKKFKRDILDKDPKVDTSSMPEEVLQKIYENIHDPSGLHIVQFMKERFLNYMSPLSGEKIDYAMIPMDPRFGSYGIYTSEKYLQAAKIKNFTPMHFWEQYDFVSEFVKLHPDMGANMIAVNPKGDSIKETIEINKPYIVKVDRNSEK
ncbi:MAG: MBL fold metallo-hydrolase [Eubacterium sp.]|nr:MBL fold metallo-hydrolase [Eubacterium sp.]